MAKEAIIKIKQAEDAGNEVVQKATEQAKQILKNAEAQGETQHKEILNQANAARAQMLQKAQDEAQQACEPLMAEGEAVLSQIANPDKQKLDKTIQLIVERIVNGYGCC